MSDLVKTSRESALLSRPSWVVLTKFDLAHVKHGLAIANSLLTQPDELSQLFRN